MLKLLWMIEKFYDTECAIQFSDKESVLIL